MNKCKRCNDIITSLHEGTKLTIEGVSDIITTHFCSETCMIIFMEKYIKKWQYDTAVEILGLHDEDGEEEIKEELPKGSNKICSCCEKPIHKIAPIRKIINSNEKGHVEVYNLCSEKCFFKFMRDYSTLYGYFQESDNETIY